jgi:hypothetical protein
MLLKVDGSIDRCTTLDSWEPFFLWLAQVDTLPSVWRIRPVRYYAKRHKGYVTVIEAWLE